jgi:acyl carrier protein
MSRVPSADDVRRLILRRVKFPMAIDDLTDDRPLGEAGVGLDSIGLVELLLDCESAFGLRVPDSVLDGDSVTVGAVIHALEAAARLDPARES